jgi:hypothetical protein
VARIKNTSVTTNPCFDSPLGEEELRLIALAAMIHHLATK